MGPMCFLAETFFYKSSSWEKYIYNCWKKTTFIYNQYRLTKQKINTVIGTWIFHTKNMFGFCSCHLKYFVEPQSGPVFWQRFHIQNNGSKPKPSTSPAPSNVTVPAKLPSFCCVLLPFAGALLDFSFGEAFFFQQIQQVA